ncbi:hypothetical protein ILYODFUR_011350 [Ilyodon furcidens]|uniref:Uncharacterized protein n=1 Tax=Ilyodon furcidens TaxID=33524 RepID=A0ABV0V4W1_9TELE
MPDCFALTESCILLLNSPQDSLCESPHCSPGHLPGTTYLGFPSLTHLPVHLPTFTTPTWKWDKETITNIPTQQTPVNLSYCG